MAGRVLGLFKGLRGKKRNGPAAATVQQPAEPEQFQPLRDDAAKEQAQEQDRPRGRFRRAAQTLWRFLRLRRRKTSGPTTEGMAEPDSRPSEPQEDDASGVTSSDFTTVSEEETALLLHLLTLSFSEASLLQGATNPVTDMEQRSTRVPKLAWVEEEEGPGAAPAQETKEVVLFELPQEGAALERTQEQDPARGLFRRTAQLVCKVIKRIREEETSTMGTGLRAYSHIFKTKTSAALLDMLVEEGFSNTKQVPALVRYIHQWLLANQFAEHRLNRTLLDLTEAQPADVLMTLLRVAPSCDRAALTMWKSIMCSPRTAEPVLLILLDVLGSWPEHSMCTSDGDKMGVFVLAAAVVMWKILQMPCVPHMVTVYFPRLFVHLLFQVLFSTLDMTEEVDTFWKGCQEQHGLATSPNRFAVQTLKSLLCRTHHEDVVVAMERSCGWDLLLYADTHHCAVGLLAREMRRGLTSLCPHMASHLLSLLIGKQARWHLPALAFFVELLECLDLSIHGASALLVVSRQLPSECRDRLRLVLRGLTVLSKEPSLAGGIRGLYQHLVEQLADADAEMVRMTLSGLTDMLQDKGLKPPSLTLLKLAESLLPLFENDNSHVRLLSIQLFCQVMELVVEEGDDPLTTIREDESPSSISVLIQLAFERRSAGLRSSAESDVPESTGDFQLPLKMGAPAEQDGPAGAPGPALAAQS
ncbi:unnamed protein product [Coccothraustes coccothraustes]